MYWFTSDTHFNHFNIIRYCNRPFASTQEMNEALIQNWNDCVKPSDIVYHLGDFGFGQVNQILKQLNGKKTLIIGSHDKDTVKCKDQFISMHSTIEISLWKQRITLCHYAMRVWPKSHYGAWHLYGHSHGNLAEWGKSFDVGVDTHDFRPYSFDEIVELMKNREDNFNHHERGNQ